MIGEQYLNILQADLFGQRRKVNSLKPDYRNRLNIPKYDKNLMPLQKVTIGSGTWTEVNPKVPRVDYLSIHFRDSLNGWAVGAQGAIIYSTDGGNKWMAINSPVTNNLLNVKNFNNQVIVAGGFNGTIIRSADGGQSWSLIQTGGVGNLWETEVINDSTAFMCGTNSSLLKTTNYGITWLPINTGINLNYWSLDFINQDIGFISCDSGKVLKTTDGGYTWILMNTGFTKHLYRIKALSEMHIVAGGQGTIYTFNGGITWNSSVNGGPIDAMAFINDSVGFVVGYSSPNFIDKTTDGGQSWLTYSANDIGSYGLMFVDEAIGFNAGSDIVIKKTTDTGATWVQKIIKDDFTNVWSISEHIAFAVGEVVYKTIDGGWTWNSTFPYDPENIGLASVFFIDSLTGFVGTNNLVRVYKTTDAGETWIRKNVTGVNVLNESIYDIFFINNSLGFASTGGGAVIKTTDGGENWFATTNSVYGVAIQFLDSLNGFTLSGWLNKTTDGGNSWVQILYPHINNPTDLFFLNDQKGWILSIDQLVITTDGGSNWTQIPEVTDFGFGYFNWSSNKRGFITGLKSYETNDSGHTWNEITNEVGYPVRMHSGNLYSGYGVGGSGLILKYFDSTYLPVELVSFNADVEINNAIISWVTVTELNNRGFDLLRSTNNNDFKAIAFIKGKGNSTSINYYSYKDNNLANGNYKYRLKQIDYNGETEFSKIIEVNLSSKKAYHFIYPNPFNNNAIITFSLPATGTAKLSVYNTLGEEIITLFNDIAEGGKEYRVNVESNNLSSGVYYYTIVQNKKLIVGKMLIIK
jgi:photosystem II stability/assembly factor-like uncharacterized protein